MPSKHDIDFVRDAIESVGYTLLENEYENSLQKLTIQCNKEHIFPMSFKVFSRGHRCSYCAGKRQYDTSEVSDILKDIGYILLTKEYKSNRQKLEVLGPDGNKYETTLFAIKVNKILPHIKNKKNKKEILCRNIFEEITGKSFEKARPEWLVNPNTEYSLELDGYCEELKLAFEYDGEYHFEKIGSSDVDTQHGRDLIKNKICEKEGVRLIRVPYYIKDKYSFIHNEILNNNKYIYVGDPHVTQNNIKESENLLNFIKNTAIQNKVNNIIILGDLFDTHGVIRSEVLNFWDRWLRELSKQFKVTILVGNHDMILGDSEYAGASPLNCLRQKYHYTLNIVDNPIIIDRIGFISFTDSKSDFLNKSSYLRDNGATLLIAHQTFIGAEYESGFPAEDGIDIDSVPQEAIISGHIHKSQQIGKVFYPGAPRWLKSTDADTDKGIWLFEHNKENPAIYIKTFISTRDIVTPIIKIVFKEGDPEPVLPNNAKVALELIGESSWIAKMRKQYKGKASIRAIPSDRKAASVDKSKLVDIEQFLAGYVKPNDSFGVQDVIEYIRGVS